MKKRKIIIDTDPGHDDALAIMLIEKSELFNVLAITTVAGNSTIQNTTNNARYILGLLKSDIPLYSGAKNPLKRKLIQANVHGTGGLAGAIIGKKERLSGDAVDQIIKIVKDNPKQISILALGPLTNIAKALKKEKSLASQIQEIVIMGGAISVPGNKNKVAEFNIFVDPEAADIVFKSTIKKILIPLDACNNIFLTLNDFKQLKKSYLYKPIQKMMKHYIKGIYLFEKTKGALMYDPIAAYFLINPDVYKTDLMDIQIETQSELTRGMTVSDRRIWGEKNYNVLVAKSVDKKIFSRNFLKILKR